MLFVADCVHATPGEAFECVLVVPKRAEQQQQQLKLQCRRPNQLPYCQQQ